MALGDFLKATGAAFGVMNVDEGDSLEWVRLTRGGGEVILVTLAGQAIRFAEESVRPMGLNAGGVMGIKRAEKDAVIGMDLVRPRADVLVVSENGYGKRTALNEYPAQGRYGVGVVTARPSPTSGPLVGAAVVQADTPLVTLTTKGHARLFRARVAPTRKRDARLEACVPLRQGDTLAALVLPLERAGGT